MHIDITPVITSLKDYVAATRLADDTSDKTLLDATDAQLMQPGNAGSQFLWQMRADAVLPKAGAELSAYKIEQELYKQFQGDSTEGIPKADHTKVINALALLEKKGVQKEVKDLFLALLKEYYSSLVVAEKVTLSDQDLPVPQPSDNFSKEQIMFHWNRLALLEKEIPKLVEQIDLDSLLSKS